MNVQVWVKSKPVEEDFIVRVLGVTEAQFDELTNEDTHYELLDNVLIMHSPASVDHEELVVFLGTLLTTWVLHHRLGRVLGSAAVLHLATGRKLEPDLKFVSRARDPLVGTEVEGTADLVIEVLSPSTRSYDLGDKREAYRKAATPEIWLVDPMHGRVVVDMRSHRTYKSRSLGTGLLKSKAVPGFVIDVAWLWQRPLPSPLECFHQLLVPSDQPREGA